MSDQVPSPTGATAEPPKSPDKRLSDLARQIRGHDDKFRKSIRTSLECARDAGLALRQAKEIIKDDGGSWTRWLKKNCKLSARQAQKYMKVAEGYADITQKGLDSGATSINIALRLLAKLRRTGTENSGNAEAATSEAQNVTPPMRISRDELNVKMQEAELLVATNKIRFVDESPEGKFVKGKSQWLVRQIRSQAEKLVRLEGRAESVQAVHMAIAIAERLSQELRAQLIAGIVSPESNVALADVAFPQDAPPVPLTVLGGDGERPIVSETIVSPARPKRTAKDHHKQNGRPALVS